MPLTQPLAELRQNLEAQIRENQLPEALNALLAQLPEGSELQRIVSALIARLNAANKERYRNTISMEEYGRMVSQVGADFLDLIGGLTEDSFEVEPASAKATAGKAGKTNKASKMGSVLYRVPRIMPIQKPTRCTIRVAIDEDAILENIVLDADVAVKSQVEISDVMRAELVDAEGDTFKITPLNAPNQLVRDSGYTEWNFSVTPLRVGVHQLLVKVSIMEIVPGYAEPIPRDISVMETVTIVTEPVLPPSPVLPADLPADFSADLSAEASAKAEAEVEAQSGSSTPVSDFKRSGESFVFQTAPTEIPQPPPALPSVEPEPPNHSTANRGLRALALFLAFIVLAPSATWALSPKLDRELFLATLQTKVTGSVTLLDDFIQNHDVENPEARPYLEKAHFRRAEKTDSLEYLRLYQQKFGADGKYIAAVRQRVEIHETNAIKSIQAQPNVVKINQFVAKFPESERLPELKKSIEAQVENRVENLMALENAYVASVQAKPTETKVTAYLRDFPKQERLNEIAVAVAAKPEVLAKARPALEEAITQKMEAAVSATEIRQLLPVLESAGSSVTADKIEKIIEQKSPQIKKQVLQQVQQAGDRVRTKSGVESKSALEARRHSRLPNK